jgi:hypothetical protein
MYVRRGVWVDGNGLWVHMNGHPHKKWQNTRFVTDGISPWPMVQATRDIRAGEEFIADYGPNFWEGRFRGNANEPKPTVPSNAIKSGWSSRKGYTNTDETAPRGT